MLCFQVFGVNILNFQQMAIWQHDRKCGLANRKPGYSKSPKRLSPFQSEERKKKSQMSFFHDLRTILNKILIVLGNLCFNSWNVNLKVLHKGSNHRIWVRVVVFFNDSLLVTNHFHIQYLNWSMQWRYEVRKSKVIFIIQIRKLKFSCFARV